MPTYSYECGSCAHVFDVFHPMSADPKVKCEKCNKKCHRLFGTGAGIIFKGSGFYETDYKDKKGKAPDAPKSEKDAGSDKSAKDDNSGKDSSSSSKDVSSKKEGSSTKDSAGKKDGGNKKKAANS